MKRPALITMAVALLLAAPASASAGTVHFEGHATGVRPDEDMKISFDVRTGKGRPQSISQVEVTDLDYRCHFGGTTERGLRVGRSGKFNRRGRFEVTERELPPLYANDVYGKFSFPKKGVRPKATVEGWISSEFGYGETRDSYNCLGSEQFIARPAR
jgi:hypothetical protein